VPRDVKEPHRPGVVVDLRQLEGQVPRGPGGGRRLGIELPRRLDPAMRNECFLKRK
jgi:hypothetical protein